MGAPTETEQLKDLFERGVAEIVDRRGLALRMRRTKALRIKFGIDPSGVHLHLGHVVPLRKLRAWQDLGHRAVLIIGDYTAQIGDPSGRNKTRPALRPDQVKRNAETYLDQIRKIIDLKRAEVHYQSEWFDDMSLQDTMKLLGGVTVQQLLAHETFRTRIQHDEPLGTHELIYPLLQGYDSVQVEADVEIGGLDQKFNLLIGRDVQKAFGQPQQDIMMLDFLIGTDGKNKMGKSLENYIAIEDTPADMFGKVMSLPDTLIAHYFEMATSLGEEEVKNIRTGLKKKTLHPRDAKIQLGEAIVSTYYGEGAAAEAASEFARVHRRKELPTAMERAEVRPGRHPILNLLVSHQLAGSRSEARRLIEQGGVKLNGAVVDDWQAEVMVANGSVLQVGKRRFIQLVGRS